MPEIADKFIMDFIRSFGTETAMKLSDEKAVANVKNWIPVLKSMRDALDTPGLPEGRMILVIGRESVGKTAFVLYLLKAIQKQGGVGAIFDQEFAITSQRAESVGVDAGRTGRLEAEYLEDMFAKMEQFILQVAKKYQGKIPIGIIIDSISATPPKEEVIIKKGKRGSQTEGYERQSMGLMARVVSKSLRRIMPLISKHRITLIIVVQLKEKIGILWGDKDDYVAKRPLDFYATYRLKLVKTGKTKDGITVRGKVLKNKLGKPFGEFNFGISFSKGVVPFHKLKGKMEKGGE